MGELTVGAVICTRNRPDDLRRTLVSIAWQTAACAEILVIDDSDAERRGETQAIVDSIDAPVRVMTKDVPGLTASRNLAIEHATSDITIFFDDDVVLRPDYIAEMVTRFVENPDVVGAGGSIDDDHDYGAPWLRGLLMIPGRKTGRVYPSGWSSQLPMGESGPVDHLIGCNMAYRTSVMRRYRFNADFRGYALGEDLDFSRRLSLDGHRLESVGSARIWHLTDLPRHDRAWGYREMAIRPIVAGGRFNRFAFLLSASTFLAVNAIKNRERAIGNVIGIGDVMRGRSPRELHTLRKEKEGQ